MSEATAGEECFAPAYHLAGIMMTAIGRSLFRLRVVGDGELRLDPSTLLVANHPHEADPVVAVAALYPRLHRPWRRSRLVHFTLRDDLYQRGFFAGYPLALPRWARRLLFPIGLGPVFDRLLPCPALRAADRMLAVDLVRAAPGAPLAELLPPALAQRFEERAAQLGRPRPSVGADVARGDFADLLWWVVKASESVGARMEEAFADRALAARRDFRRFVDVVRSGGVVLISPEGRSSPDGALQPLKPGAAALVRLARPRVVRALGIAYDPLVHGRPLAYVGVGTEEQPPRREADAFVRGLLTRTVPLAVGQVVADALLSGTPRSAIADRLARDVEDARRTGRPAEQALDDPAVRTARVERALAVAERHPERLPRLRACYRSARA